MKRRQQGAYLVMMTVLIVVLIAVAALAIDVGRLLLMRTDMQNAADAAALAAAAELDADSNARARARAAARDLLEHDARFARVSELLGATGLPDDAFEFFCVIGSETDVDPAVTGFTDFCSGSLVETDKYAATNDEDTHYVRVTLDPELVGDGDRFTADLIFLPALRAFGIDVADTASAVATALAGRNFFTCNYPPMAMCDPWESEGSHFRDEMEVGAHIQMRQQGANQWSSGNFGFLQPPNAGPGATDVSEFIANEGGLGCNPATFTTQTGSMTNKTRGGWNTRFGIYDGPNPFQNYDADYPPAPNVVGYPLDSGTDSVDSRIGDGLWDVVGYWAAQHGGVIPGGWNNANPPSRYEVYQYEIANGLPTDGTPDDPAGDADRRVMNMAVLSCEALGITGGKKSGVIFPADGFARMFLVRPAEGPPNLTFYGEFIGWAQENDDDYHVQIQLYE
ncbi:pilus assembly protein TadG-related protein [Alcanivorax sp. S6407]|uniref:pilus assembly protein TadG-related protein n=1 Tax=Alcanivorax sp. S6407 TaxID=2926424 RepID=UPI001FF4B4FE|nr:pilus assembly protein TadG-related protein [Alcanivorax sp. S6407]MCK0153401.1 pilus assembly protein TadG-related protein [Alcanivorax sp. S6407]